MSELKLTHSFWSATGIGHELLSEHPQATVVYLYLAAGPSHLKLFRLDKMLAEHRLGLSSENLEQCLDALEAGGHIMRDKPNNLVWVVRGCEDAGQLKPRDHKVKAYQKEFDALPDSTPLREPFFGRYAASLLLTPTAALRELKAPPLKLEVHDPVLARQLQAAIASGALTVIK